MSRSERSHGPGALCDGACPTPFHGVYAPEISLAQYLERIFTYANCSFSCFVLAYVYIHRFIELNPHVPIASTCVHRLLITSVLLAAKFLDDVYYSNAFYANVGGITTAELNMLEIELLKRLDYRLHVHPEALEQAALALEAAASQPASLAAASWPAPPLAVVPAPRRPVSDVVSAA